MSIIYLVWLYRKIKAKDRFKLKAAANKLQHAFFITLSYNRSMIERIHKTEEEWKKALSSEEYAVLREKGTEAPGSGKYLDERKKGIYNCRACGNPLFASDAKYDSSLSSLNGWPSFDQALPGAIIFETDNSFGMNRTEVLCAVCNSHLGHVFNDEEARTGKHYCMNSVCLNLKED